MVILTFSSVVLSLTLMEISFLIRLKPLYKYPSLNTLIPLQLSVESTSSFSDLNSFSQMDKMPVGKLDEIRDGELLSTETWRVLSMQRQEF